MKLIPWHRRLWVNLVALVVMLYLLVANIVFGYRHPWMTDAERFWYLPEVVTFGSVKYSEARPR